VGLERNFVNLEKDKRLIEDYLPIEAISAEASREKSVRKGHISTLHLWWARRPLVACRAAVYGALVPAARFVPNGATDEKKKSLGRANAAKFVERLCKYPGNPTVIAEAQRHILEAHAERLTNETGKKVTVEDIVEGRAPRPKVLDMFAGGGAIPLEALRLGCEAYALDLNPVAHIIELCTLVYPQKYGKADTNARGMTGLKNDEVKTTWGGLAEEVRYWGNWVLEEVKAKIGDLYPLIPDPEFKGKKAVVQGDWLKSHATHDVPPGYLIPVAYLWTRTVTCKNPSCGAIVPLVKQTWLCKKGRRYVALKMIAPRGKKQVRFEVVKADSEKGVDFDPTGFSKGGNATCPFCGTVADSDYVKVEGCNQRMGQQMMSIVCVRPGSQGKIYLSADDFPSFIPDNDAVRKRLDRLCMASGLTVPKESIITDAKNSCWTHLYGLTTFADLFTPRQMLCLLSLCAEIRNAYGSISDAGSQSVVRSENLQRGKSVAAAVGFLVDKISTRNNSADSWDAGYEKIMQVFGRQAIPMVWDFAESNPLAGVGSGNFVEAIGGTSEALASCAGTGLPANVARGTATQLPWLEASIDAVITDPPYYDNVPYANISDFFYVWLRRTVGALYPEHFAAPGTPKKQEAVADATRYGNSKDRAREAYEGMMAQAFAEAYRVLKPSGAIVVVYAHKTTLGWATLLNALRSAGFMVTEAWPLDTEGQRLRAINSAALASSIFLVACKRNGVETGNYEDVVKPELGQIVRERVGTLWEMGISGADLVIACVGAGLRAFTRFARVEYANGEEVPAERFLAEVETVVLETILARLSKEVGGNGGKYSLAGLDPATRFYVLWRYTYKAADLDAGEAIIFANGTHVELDGPHGLSTGSHNLIEKKKGKYRLLDFSERGDDKHLGLPADDGQPAPLVDALHRTLWLLEKHPTQLSEFLRESQANREQLRLVAQALAGPALKGGELADVSPSVELSVLAKLMANWQSVVEDAAMTAGEKEDRKTGQKRLDI
jgi:putative DNA methylase